MNPSSGLFSSSTVAGGDRVCQLPSESPIQSEFTMSEDSNPNV